MAASGLHLYCDADFAGDPYTLKSTSGAHMSAERLNTRSPFSAGVEGQTSRAQSPTEAEVCSLGGGMRDRGDPSFFVWETIFGQYHKQNSDWRLTINLHEDNTTFIITHRTGKNATMKTLEKCFDMLLATFQ